MFSKTAQSVLSRLTSPIACINWRAKASVGNTFAQRLEALIQLWSFKKRTMHVSFFLYAEDYELCSILFRPDVSYTVFMHAQDTAGENRMVITNLCVQFCVISDRFFEQMATRHKCLYSSWELYAFLPFVRKTGMLPIRMQDVHDYVAKDITFDQLEARGGAVMVEIVTMVEHFKRKQFEYKLSLYSRFEETAVATESGYMGLNIREKRIGPVTDAGLFLPMLPPELRLMVMTHLDIKSLATLAMVSRHAKQESSDWVLWKPFVEDDLNLNLKCRQMSRRVAISLYLDHHDCCYMCGEYLVVKRPSYRGVTMKVCWQCTRWQMPSFLKQTFGVTKKQARACVNSDTIIDMGSIVHLGITIHGGTLDTLNAYLVAQYHKAVKRQVNIWRCNARRKKHMCVGPLMDKSRVSKCGKEECNTLAKLADTYMTCPKKMSGECLQRLLWFACAYLQKNEKKCT